MLWSIAELAWPCAGLVHEEGGVAESNHGEAIIEILDGEVDAEYKVEYYGSSVEFGWIVPAFGEVLDVADGDAADFDALREHTAPQVVTDIEEPQRRGCGAGAKSGGLRNDGDGGEDLGVDVVAEGFTGTYAYTVVAADDGTALTGWLDANGWVLGDGADDVAAYAGEGVQFVLFELSTASPPEHSRDLPPVHIRYSGTDARFPARMARHASEMEQYTTLYVIADERVSLGGWSEVEQEWIGLGDAEPTEGWEAYLRSVGGASPTYHVTWSGSYGERWLTRFDTIANRDAHTADVAFVADGGQTSAYTELHRTSDEAGVGLVASVLALLGGALVRRRSIGACRQR